MPMPSDYTSERGLTVRQQVMDLLEAKVVAMQDFGEDVWREVFRGDVDTLDNVSGEVCAVDFGTEEMLNNTFPCSTYSLPVFFHFRFRGQRGLDEHNAYMYYLGLLQYAVLQDHNLDGLTLDVKELSNSHTIVGVEGVYPGGTLVTEVIYKTRLHNPHLLPHQAP